MNPNKSVQNSNYVILEDASLQEALRAITANHRGCVVVVSRDWLVLGVLSDGDIRRAMVRGATTITPVSKVSNSNFVSVATDDRSVRKNSDEFFKKHPHITLVPVLDKGNTLVDILVRR